ncbi:MAG TPA: hypothetical protein QF484_05580 [Candidatus Marinimicrobia bacterium]|jgi:hypothetical protein|nr:hypothetical protein [Candidatus Neomarinimicrobiota bacterium]MDP7512909.1 hypothetical protein [Candidatus Neomarinimicrobiota bacterium]HJL63224.1 hypothetical protein [Candidatus Neomarinimicrobiota bacterium]HJM12633.1 hypothetical protein [Candidatus Neomarinimicrobiota bacterium]|tara:strand:- start:133 stop:600 length:468 start_codon:yes stop_codon:yes gene_type:complete
MAEAPKQIEELTPEEQFVKEKVDALLEKVGEGHGEPMQQELADRLEKTVNGFHADASEMIDNLKAKSEERRGELKNLWEHRNEDSVQEKQPKTETVDESVEEPAETSAWEKRLESKTGTVKEEPKKAAKAEKPQKEEPKKKKKFGFFKRKKKKKE